MILAPRTGGVLASDRQAILAMLVGLAASTQRGMRSENTAISHWRVQRKRKSERHIREADRNAEDSRFQQTLMAALRIGGRKEGLGGAAVPSNNDKLATRIERANG